MELIKRKREIEDAVAKKRRAVDRRSEEKAVAAALDDGRTVDQLPQKRTGFHATFGLVKDGLQTFASCLPGLKRLSQWQEISHKDVRDERLAAALLEGVYDFFCKDGNFGFILDLIAKLPQALRPFMQHSCGSNLKRLLSSRGKHCARYV
jgi:hypothetical protein